MKIETLTTLPLIIGMVGMLTITVLAFLIDSKDPEFAINSILFSLIFFTMMTNVSVFILNSHFKRIFEKAGLWQDEIIKKDELKK